MPRLPPDNSRRDFLKKTSATTLTAGLASGLVVPRAAHAGESETLRVGLIGCGGRGTQAVIDALTADPHTQLVAIGDAFKDRALDCLANLKESEKVRDRIVVDEDHVFGDFDAFRKVTDSGVDVVILTTSPHFRPEHLAYAVEAGKHCFVEKPIAVDAPGVRSVQATCERAREKGLSIVSGLHWRYSPGMNEMVDQIREGAIGDIVAIQSNWNVATLWHRGNKPEWSRMEYQMRNWYYYTWLCGDHIVEQAIHSLDKCAWLQGDTQPLRANGMGGRQQRTASKYGHIFDHHSVVYDFPEDLKVFFTCRQQDNVAQEVEDHVLGTKGIAHMIRHRIEGENKWRYRGSSRSPYDIEHEKLFASIRSGSPINNGDYMCNSTMIAIMGRMATYTGKTVTWDECYNSEVRLGPETYEWGDMPEPSVAIPGVTTLA